MIISCIAALCFGMVIGYVLNWAVRHNPKPDAKEVSALIAAVVGGTVVSLIRNLINCPNAISWYLIGLAIGFFLYTIAIWKRWELMTKLTRLPFLPWTVK